MRKVKFRGKTDDDRWVYGYMFKSNEAVFIMEANGTHKVIEETVGQLVSETLDIEGKEVYEGDFVETNYTDPYCPKIAEIVYGGMYGIAGFGLAFKENEFKDKPIWDILHSSLISTIKVIGNAHDNRELWKKTVWKMVDKSDIIVLEDDGEID